MPHHFGYHVDCPICKTNKDNEKANKTLTEIVVKSNPILNQIVFKGKVSDFFDQAAESIEDNGNDNNVPLQ